MFLGDLTWPSLQPCIHLAETVMQFKLSWLYCMGKLWTSAWTAGKTPISALCFICCTCAASWAVTAGMKLEGSIPACQGCCSGGGTFTGRDLLKHLPVCTGNWHLPSLIQQNMFPNYKLNTNCESLCFLATKDINANVFNKLLNFLNRAI